MDTVYIDSLKEAADNHKKLNPNYDRIYAMLQELEEIEGYDIRNDVYDARVLRQEHPEQRQRLLLNLGTAKENALRYYEAIDFIVEELMYDIIKHNSQELAKQEAERSK